ncbi:hypothetical protein [Subtercola sp. RTI3]|uniref:hypothetical protein n=1 Tax=Subtercola sp. RTI3 TaxID=3048639 RepID=UPI002B22949A|nr:hypothetical protein [Subtercola sp. RTI3]MEA9983914.1 hypothetical protein [Subtercola sp. RTI3]
MTNLAPAYSPTIAPSDSPELDPFDDFPAPSWAPSWAPGHTPGTRPGIRSTLTLAGNRVLRRRKPKLAYAAVVIVGVMAIVVTQLLLSIGLSNGAYQIESLQSTQKDLGRSNESLSEKIDSLSSPQNLAASAESLGMVSNVNPVYLRLSDGAVLGTPKKAQASAGSLTGGQSSLTPNAAIAGAAAAGQPATPTAAAGAAAVTPSAPPAAAAAATVPWTGELPSPTTH